MTSRLIVRRTELNQLFSILGAKSPNKWNDARLRLKMSELPGISLESIVNPELRRLADRLIGAIEDNKIEDIIIDASGRPDSDGSEAGQEKPAKNITKKHIQYPDEIGYDSVAEHLNRKSKKAKKSKKVTEKVPVEEPAQEDPTPKKAKKSKKVTEKVPVEEPAQEDPTPKKPSKSAKRAKVEEPVEEPAQEDPTPKKAKKVKDWSSSAKTETTEKAKPSKEKDSLKANSGQKKKGSKEEKAKKPGVIATILSILQNASAKKPVKKEEILTQLVAKFPDRPEGSMRSTINIQVPSRLRVEKGVQISKNENGYWAE
jgi:hypothetical protein